MLALRNLILVSVIMAGFALLSLQEVSAFELTGAWATSADQCGKVGRTKRGSRECGPIRCEARRADDATPIDRRFGRRRRRRAAVA